MSRKSKAGKRREYGKAQEGHEGAVVRVRLLYLVSLEVFVIATLIDPSLGGPVLVA